MTHKKPTHCYIARKPCGCVTTLMAYHYEWRNHTAQQVAEAIKRGEFVHPVTWAEYEQMDISLDPCPHGEIVSADLMQPSLLVGIDE